MQFCSAKVAVVSKPSGDNRVQFSGYGLDIKACPGLNFPVADLRADLLQRFPADGRAEAREAAMSFRSSLPRAEAEPQKVE